MKEMITLKLEKDFLQKVDSLLTEAGYDSRTEFIRDSLRDKMDKIRTQQVLMHIARFKGISGTKTSDDDLEMKRDKVVKKYLKKYQMPPRA